MRDFLENHADSIKLFLKILSAVFPLSLLGTCFYESDAEKERKSRKWNPTPENIIYWEEQKQQWLTGLVCGELDDEVRMYEKKKIFCSAEFSIVEGKARFLADNKPWFGSRGIPNEYHSFDAIEISIDTLPCETQVRRWKTCPTGFSREKVY